MKNRRNKAKYFIDKKSKSIYNSSGKIICFSYRDFLEKIVKGNHCFICGAEPGSKPFNSEHVIPKWILKHYGDHDSFMILPNRTEIKNNKYLLPCCSDCNAELGNTLENPIRTLLCKSYRDVFEELEKDESLYRKIYHWVALIFFKTHLKDKYLLKDRDRRKHSGVISDDYCWHCLYHIHNIIRQHYTGTKIANSAYGTILVYESLREQEFETFDYLDNLNSQIVMIQVGSIVIFVALTDCKASLGLYRTFFSKIKGSLTTAQIREVFARLRYVIENLKYKPKFVTTFKGKNPKIIAKLEDKFAMYEGSEQRKSLFELMRFYIGDAMPSTLTNREELLKDLEEGKAQYIFDENYNFVQHTPYSLNN